MVDIDPSFEGGFGFYTIGTEGAFDRFKIEPNNEPKLHPPWPEPEQADRKAEDTVLDP